MMQGNLDPLQQHQWSAFLVDLFQTIQNAQQYNNGIAATEALWQQLQLQFAALPAEELAELKDVKERVDAATREAHAADAAVQAVQQVLEVKKGALQRAQQAASKATARLKESLDRITLASPPPQ